MERRSDPWDRSSRKERDSNNKEKRTNSKPGICNHFAATGRCKFGENCKYSHDLSSEKTPRNITSDGICRLFSTPSGCRYGTACRYRHDGEPPSNNGLRRKEKPPGHHGATDKRRKWSDALVSPDSTSPPRALFIAKTGIELIDFGDHTLQQRIIQELGSESGLMWIRELLGKNYNLDTSPQVNRNDGVQLPRRIIGFSFHTHCVPFLNLLTHEKMMSSIALENTVGTIYNVVYGPSGSRGGVFFEAMVKHLTTLHGMEMEDPETTFEEPAYLISAALFHTINLNQGSLAQTNLRDLVERLALVMREYGGQDRYFIRKAVKHVDGLIQRFNIRTVAVEYRQDPAPVAQKFRMQIDLPGELSLLGPRHDNDFADIRNILILPTSQEISSSRQPYLPYHITETSNHEGISSLLDSNFRLLREDTSGQIRDALAAVFHSWDTIFSSEDMSARKRAVRAIEQPITVFRNIQLEQMSFKRNILAFDISFDQPNPEFFRMDLKRREAWWTNARMLSWGSLLAFVSEGRSMFFSVSDRIIVEKEIEDMDDNDSHLEAEEDLNTDAKSRVRDLASNPNRAMIRLKLAEPAAPENGSSLAQLMELSKPGDHKEALLIEFSKLLYASFEPVLTCIQDMQYDPRVPFSHWLAPPPGSEFEELDGTLVIPPPLYMMRRPNPVLDLTSITIDGHRLTHSISSPVSVEALKEHTSLDNGQCNSILRALQTELALIQGPPGTGKSYIGVQLSKVLLDNARKLNLGPILCVTYTNHALDQFLEHIMDAGEDSIIRIGARSKSERLREKMLSNFRRNINRTAIEWQKINDLESDLESIRMSLIECLKDMSQADSPRSIAEFLNSAYPGIHDSLFDTSVLENKPDEDGYQEVRHKKHGIESLYKRWTCNRSHPSNRRSRRIGIQSNRTVEELQFVNDIWDTSPAERLRLKVYWEEHRRQQLQNKFTSLMERHTDAYKRLHRQHSEIDRQCLSSCRVIGTTSTGLASNASLLRSLQCRVLIIEEAGEVLEAHTLVSLIPTIEHCILIGDHLQLRPQINRYDLSMESSQGKMFALNMSLFERLATYGVRGYKVPISQLDVQRRMHPWISNLIRSTLYPQLIDHIDTNNHPEVAGMRNRLFWLDHSYREGNNDGGLIHDGPKDMSRTNEWEANLCVSLVQHLSRQGTYKKDDIAVITPYLGQLRKLRDKFRNLCDVSSISLSDRDLTELAIEERENTGVTEEVPIVHVKNIISGIRLATVDNFQGEEAKVVVISLVRSNPEGKVGFLRTFNRINVLLSRAQHGMYLIGNSNTAKGIPMWNEVLTILRNNGQIGTSLELLCPRHPDFKISVSSPDEFNRLAPEGGCSMRCDRRLECGHACVVKCHADYLHKTVRCFQDCLREFEDCEHPCPKKCWENCGKCIVPITSNITLPCGHTPKSLPCYKTTDLSKVRCSQRVTRIVAKCQHRVTVSCSTNMAFYPCPNICGSTLPCGHTCQRKCYECRSDDTDKVDHGKCNTVCGRPYTTCNHSCQSPCHDGNDCGKCQQRCEIRCAHSKCSKGCAEACSPCAERCTAGCVHQGKCNMPCAVPCDVLPCSRRCEYLLECGHRCPSVCGEFCPSPETGCQLCASPDTLSKQVDLITMESFEEIDADTDPLIFLPCGHIYTVSTLDGHMGMKDVYDIDSNGCIIRPRPFSKIPFKSCPECRHPLRQLHRYNRIVKAALLDQTTKRFMAYSGTLLDKYLEEVNEWEITLENIAEKFITGYRNRTEEFRDFFGYYKRKFTAMLQSLARFEHQVGEAEQPWGRVATIVRATLRRNGTSSEYRLDTSEIQHGFSIKAQALYLRVAWTAMYHLSRALGTDLDKELIEREREEVLHPTLQDSMLKATALIEKAEAGNFIYQELEGRIFRAMFAGLMFRHAPSGSDADAIAQGRLHFLADLNVCEEKMRPSTESLKDDIRHAKALLRGATFYQVVSNQERAAVYAAMAREFRGTGHWYYCENNHPFTIGECGMAMQLSRCPECGAPVGGGDHRSVAGNSRADDIEREFGRMQI